MGELLWPGDARAGDVLTDEAFLAAMVRVEQAWLDALVGAGLASTPAVLTVPPLRGIADGTESGGNPVIPLVKALRAQSPDVHRGLTSQDVVDTALVLCLRDVVDRVLVDVERAARTLGALAREHRGAVMVGRTLTQYAVPITFGLKAAQWLSGLAEADAGLRRVRAELPVQVGGAAGTLAAVVELGRDREDPVGTAVALVHAVADGLGLGDGTPWHTRGRNPLAATADALVRLADALGHLGADVALLSRPEIGELREGAGGGSSTMPGKANPVLSILLRRHALAAPQLAATLHLAAATYVDERPDGGWHAEWDTLATLGRRSVVAASQAADLVAGLVVDTARMAARVAEAGETLRAEQRSMSGGSSDGDYLGATDLFIDDILGRAARVWENL
ncbi:lyase family protein [Nocardioides sp. BP30]|uniref:lyase family protein n=1 Tax=Nocardioides sp. BP30 TaxID=3036374 RepID=UPI0024693A43|nr:lyase family protein [Nocardioides sp. BP30]WGL52211.1 lyase family protein [Nocardioides sp. BP30]